MTLTKILLIEDDEADYFILSKHLAKSSNLHYQLDWESSYQAGLERMLSNEHDLCMLDYRLGEYNGIQLIKEARQQGYSGPIVLLTGADESEIDIQALQAGADDYISKNQLDSNLLPRVIRYAIERKKTEHERERLLHEQIASKELDQRKNEFVGIVVHELKTPLTSLKGFAQLLRRRLSQSVDQQARQLANRIDVQTNKLTSLIDDMLDVTRIEGGTFQFDEEAFVFDELVEEIVEELQLTTEKQQIIRQGQTDKSVWGDRQRVGQVITNLLSNAIKYAPAAPVILLNLSTDDSNVSLSVQDSGPGIPLEKQQRIFEPFYRIEASEQRGAPGLGLGLFISAEIIQRQNGTIWVQSVEGQGTTFGFTLPINKPQT